MSYNRAIAARRVRVSNIESLAVDILRYELEPADGRALPSFEAGAHIDVHVPNGPIRQYSLCGASGTNAVYSIAVKREANSQGGSMLIHDALEMGSVLGIGVPRNNFPLFKGRHKSLFIAGGIGITPIYAMITTLATEGYDWELHYCARSREHAAFYDNLVALSPPHVHSYFSEVPILDVAALLDAQPDGTHVYCCGPTALMSAVDNAASDWPDSRRHFEWFSAPPSGNWVNEPFEVVLKRSNRTLTIPADRSILDVLREHNVSAPSSCLEGVCGSCETRVLEGVPDHRDALLTPAERAAGGTMMICVSRAKGGQLILDL